MRIALISDIHGNDVPFKAVLKDIKEQGVDEIICLGDVATLGPQPCEAVERLRALGCRCITGNHETDLLNVATLKAEQKAPAWLVETLTWCDAELSDEDLDFLQGFEDTIEIDLEDGANLLCFHGSPQSNTDIILADTSSTELDELLTKRKASVMVGGHTHIQMMRRYKDVLIVNAGSVGAPMELPFEARPTILSYAEYAIIEVSKNKGISVDLRRVVYDFDAMKRAAAASTNPFPWINFWNV